MSEAFADKFFGLTAKHRLEEAASSMEQAGADLRQGNFAIGPSIERALTAIDQVKGLRGVRDRYAALGLPVIPESHFITPSPIEAAPAQPSTVAEPPKDAVDAPAPVEPVALPQPVRVTVLPPTGPRERRPIVPVEPQRPVVTPPAATTFGEPSLVGPAVIQESRVAQAQTAPAVLIRPNSSFRDTDGKQRKEPTTDEIREWYEQRIALAGGDPSNYLPSSRRDEAIWNLMTGHRSVIVHDDPGFFVIDKPVGVPTHHGQQVRIGVEEIFRHHYQDAIAAAHRLDRETSGLQILARTQPALDSLKMQFANVQGNMVKLHVALLDGRLDHKGFLTTNIEVAPDPDKPGSMVIVDGSKQVDPRSVRSTESHFLPLAVYEDHNNGRPRTLTQVQIITGRQHQVRMTALSLDAPIHGDNLYNPEGANASRLMLHHVYMAFNHPETGERLRLVAKFPADFRRVLGYMDPSRKRADVEMFRHNWLLSVFGDMPELADALRQV